MNRALGTGVVVVMILFVIFAVAGCGLLGGGEAEPPPPTMIDASFVVDRNVNPVEGRPSPIVVRLYELKAPDVFRAGGFFELYRQADTTLAADLVATAEITLKPGETRNLERELAPETRHLGFVAAYRNVDQAVWRQLLDVRPHQTTRLLVELGRTALDITVPAD